MGEEGEVLRKAQKQGWEEADLWPVIKKCDNVEVVSPDVAQDGPFLISLFSFILHSDVQSLPPLPGSVSCMFSLSPLSLSLLSLCPNSH